jgi:flagellar FliJ protein
MAKFKFRLETLLKLRDRIRDERRAELAQAYHAAEILGQRRQELEDELAGLIEQNRAAAGPGAVDVDRLLDARRYELVLRSHQQLNQQQQRALDAEIDRRRRALVEANREVRVLEKLREKQEDRHRQQQARQEIKELDEAGARGRWRGER